MNFQGVFQGTRLDNSKNQEFSMNSRSIWNPNGVPEEILISIFRPEQHVNILGYWDSCLTEIAPWVWGTVAQQHTWQKNKHLCQKIISELAFAWVSKRVSMRNWKCGLPTALFSCISKSFLYKRFSRGLVLKSEHKVTQKWPVTCCFGKLTVLRCEQCQRYYWASRTLIRVAFASMLKRIFVPFI